MWVGLPGGVPAAPLSWAPPTDPLLPLRSPGPPGDGYVQADAKGPRDYEDHLYVNTQGLDAPEALQLEDSPKKDLFDMRMWGPPSLRGEAMALAARGLLGAARPSSPWDFASW